MDATDAPNPSPDPPSPAGERTEPDSRSHARGLGRGRSMLVLTLADLRSMTRSWLVRGFLLITAVVTLLELKGMQGDQVVASQILEAVYVTYILIWMHGVVFIAGSALSREQDCLTDAILSRGVTRGEYLGSKLLARSFAIALILAIVLLPGSFWAIRQDKLVRTETGFISANAKNTRIEAWDPKKVFSEVDGPILEMTLDVGDEVHSGDVLALIDDRRLLDELETERRAEQDARNEVDNSHRRFENAKRAIEQAEELLTRAERALVAQDLMSKQEQANLESDLRARKRDLQNAENDMRVARDGINKTEREVENARTRVLAVRKRVSRATITAPLSGFLTEVLVQASEHASLGAHLFTISPLDEYQLRVPVYKFSEFKRLKKGLDVYITVQGTEFKGVVDRLGAMTEADRWGRLSNYAIVRFQGDGTLGLLGLDADVRIVLPPIESEPTRAAALMNAFTGHGQDDLETRTASVTIPWMLIALAKVLACACFLCTLALMLVALFRHALLAILGTIGLWHISNLIFDFAGLPNLSYLEMVRTIDKVLGGVAAPAEELSTLAWLMGITLAFAVSAIVLFIKRDPPK